MGTDGYRVPTRKKFLGTDGYRVPARKNFWVPMGTGYRPEKKFSESHLKSKAKGFRKIKFLYVSELLFMTENPSNIEINFVTEL